MKSLLNALQEGRFVELPETNKEKALHYLATLIEAIPDLNPGTDVAEAVLARELQFNTGIGLGWACPHMRTNHDGEMLCAAGWSPEGIDYGGPDQKPVHWVVMYYVPDCQKNVYLKEISSLAKAIQKTQSSQNIFTAAGLPEARGFILDLVSSAVEASVSDAKARMIHLEARHAVASSAMDAGAPGTLALNRAVIPLSVLVVPGGKPVILSQDAELVAKLESAEDLTGALAKQTGFDAAGYRILFRAVSSFQPRRLMYDCLAIHINGEKPKA